MPHTFLTARWQDLLILTWAVPDELLLPRVPRGLELDRWDGQASLSLVAFDFRECRVKGCAVPGLVNFPEVNLRFYVREAGGGRRGVVFIREFVPSRLIAAVANVVYNEPYRAVTMSSRVEQTGDRVQIEHRLRSGSVELGIFGESTAGVYTPAESSIEHFFKEHSWGYGTDKRGRVLVYEVRHPVWETRRGCSIRVQGDLGAIYGEEWSFLNTQAPLNALVAVGSKVEVLGHARLSA